LLNRAARPGRASVSRRHFGPVTHAFDVWTVNGSRVRARDEGMPMDFLAADGSCDIGTIPITAGPMYVHAATANDRLTFARVSKAHSSP
jgi:hypothetical protein